MNHQQRMQMATSREYAYYLKGGKVAIVERDYNDANGLTSPSSAPSIDLPNTYAKWKSPNASVTDGIEIEYTHVPTYTISNTTGVQPVFGWGFRYDNKLGIFNTWASFSALNTIGEPVYFKGTRWAGLQEIAVAGNSDMSAYFTAKAHVSEQFPNGATQLTGQPVNIVALSGTTYAYMLGYDADAKDDIELFKDLIVDAEYYIHLSGMGTAGNNGIFKAESSSIHGQINLISKAAQSENEYTFAAFTGTAVSNDTNTKLTYVRYEPGFEINTAVDNTLKDESDTVDLPPYLSSALVLYIKGQLSEDQGDLKMKEYFMKEFRRMVEKDASSKVWAARMISSGPSAIR